MAESHTQPKAAAGRQVPPLILADADAARRMSLLADLQDALAELDIDCVLARNHRLVLRYNRAPCEPSGLTEPQLHIFTPGGTDIATTDGTVYVLTNDRQHPASDPAGAAAIIGQPALQHVGKPARCQP